MKIELINAEKANYPLKLMLRVLGVPASSYHEANRREESAQAAWRKKVTGLIDREFHATSARMGIDKMMSHLVNIGAEQELGGMPSRGLVASIMRRHGWRSKRHKAYRATTVQDPQAKFAPDALGRDFTNDDHAPGQMLVGDITYLRTEQGWLYLATVIDLATRMVLGWATGENMKASLVVRALAAAVDSGRVPAGATFHSDRGSQYSSKAFTAYCAKAGITPSMGATGVCWDNAVAESFFSCLKNEDYYHHGHPTREHARARIAAYIEGYYNTVRPHTRNGGLPPAAAWALKTSQLTLAA